MHSGNACVRTWYQRISTPKYIVGSTDGRHIGKSSICWTHCFCWSQPCFSCGVERLPRSHKSCIHVPAVYLTLSLAPSLFFFPFPLSQSLLISNVFDILKRKAFFLSTILPHSSVPDEIVRRPQVLLAFFNLAHSSRMSRWLICIARFLLHSPQALSRCRTTTDRKRSCR